MFNLVIVLIILGGIYIYSGLANVSEKFSKSLNILVSGFLLKMAGEKVARLVLGLVIAGFGVYLGVSSGAFDF